MDEKEYGLLNLFLLYSGIFTIILNLGISRSFAYLYWDVYKSEADLKKLISSTITLLFIFQLILVSVSLFFGESIISKISNSDDEFTFFPYFVLSIFYSCFMVYYEMFQFFFRNKENLKLYSILTVGTLVLFTIGNLVGVVFLDLKSIGAVYGRTISYGLISIAFLLYFIRKYGFSFDRTIYKSILIFGFPLFVNSLIGAVAYGFDKILIEQLDNLETLGIYGFALIAVTVLEIFFNAVNNAFTPTIFRYLKESFNDKAEVIESIVFLIILSVMILAVVIISLFYPMLELFIPENYHLSGKYVPILVCAFFWRVLTGIKSYSLFKEKKTNYFLLNQSSILISIILFGYFGYEYFGIMGIIYAVYFSKLIEFIIMNLISNKVSRLPIRIKNLILMMVLISVISFFISDYDYDHTNIYLVYFTPLLAFILAAPILLQKEFRTIFHLIKNRKEIL
ncbi:MAG: O-antigen/teichoic acid export membrane protein [Vicingaceae bacterium]|jgi:O-antigen/teichoic acid export membrane protein